MNRRPSDFARRVAVYASARAESIARREEVTRIFHGPRTTEQFTFKLGVLIGYIRSEPNAKQG